MSCKMIILRSLWSRWRKRWHQEKKNKMNILMLLLRKQMKVWVKIRHLGKHRCQVIWGYLNHLKSWWRDRSWIARVQRSDGRCQIVSSISTQRFSAPSLLTWYSARLTQTAIHWKQTKANSHQHKKTKMAKRNQLRVPNLPKVGQSPRMEVLNSPLAKSWIVDWDP